MGRTAARCRRLVTGNIGIQLGEMSKINFWPSTYRHCKKHNLVMFVVHDKYFVTRRPIWTDDHLQSHISAAIFFLLLFQEGKRERKKERNKQTNKQCDILLERQAYSLVINHPHKVKTFTTQGHCNSDIFTWYDESFCIHMQLQLLLRPFVLRCSFLVPYVSNSNQQQQTNNLQIKTGNKIQWYLG
jgi:hypothetical protein